jgi:hypothetical protein
MCSRCSRYLEQSLESVEISTFLLEFILNRKEGSQLNAKRYLNQIRKIDKKVENKKLEIQSLYDALEQCTTHIKEVDIQTSLDTDKNSAIVAEIVDLKNELVDDINELLKIKIQTIKMINMIDDDEFVAILMRRYVLLQEWHEIADAMNFTRQTIDNKHGRALIEFEKVLTRFDII